MTVLAPSPNNASEDELEELADLQLIDAGMPPWEPLPHQITPTGDWFFWLMEAGRGAGKTATAAHYVKDHLNGPACISEALPHRVALIAPTLGDAIESAALTDMALVRLQAGATFTQSGGGSMVKWANKSQVRLFGTHSREDVNRLRAGGNRCLVWAEELASWSYLEEAWSDMMFGLRLGPNPRIIATTTPKPRPAYIAIRATAKPITHATTLENPNLNAEQKARLVELYDGTTIGEQELYGRLIEEAEGAIWSMRLIEDHRLDPSVLDELDDGLSVLQHARVVVAIDPPGGATEAGIVIAGTIRDCPCDSDAPKPHFSVLEDLSGKFTPEVWASRAVDGFERWEADRVVAEINYGGDMVKSVIKTVDPNVPYRGVRATRGKKIRAEPILALYEQGRVHHIGIFAPLESEMVTWVEATSDWSPNRLDALVWAISELSKRKEWIVG